MQQYTTLCQQHEWTKSPTLWRHTSPPRFILHLNYFSHATDSNYTVLSLLNTSRPLKALLILHLNWFYEIIEGNYKTIVSANCVYVSQIIGFTFPAIHAEIATDVSHFFAMSNFRNQCYQIVIRLALYSRFIFLLHTI